MTRPTAALLPALVVGLVVTLAVSVSPAVPAATAQPTLRVVLDTVVALVALLLAYLVLGRFLLSRRTADLLLVSGLALAAVLNATVAVGPQLGPSGHEALALLAWGPPVGRVAVAVLFVLAALWPAEATCRLRHPVLVVATGCLALVLLVSGGVTAAAELLPASAVPDLDARGPVLNAAGGTGLLAATGVLGSVLYGLAAGGFRTRDDPLAPTLTAASVLLAFALLNHAFVPSVYPQWVYTGDVLRLGAYAVLLLGAAGEIRRYWADQARLAVEEERRRVARTLHDGVAQEACLLAGQMRLWAQGRPTLEPRLLAGAAERALDESRAAIAALNGQFDEPLDQALLRLADDVEARVGVPVRTDVRAVPVLPRPAREALLRAAREAVLDAARGDGAREVVVTLRGGPEIQVTVMAPGRVPEPGQVDRVDGGLRLGAARKRLQAVGGRLVESGSAGGRLELWVPCAL